MFRKALLPPLSPLKTPEERDISSPWTLGHSPEHFVFSALSPGTGIFQKLLRPSEAQTNPRKLNEHLPSGTPGLPQCRSKTGKPTESEVLPQGNPSDPFPVTATKERGTQERYDTLSQERGCRRGIQVGKIYYN